jgi:hypothetical protein
MFLNLSRDLLTIKDMANLIWNWCTYVTVMKLWRTPIIFLTDTFHAACRRQRHRNSISGSTASL